jgi:hypothetical protein
MDRIDPDEHAIDCKQLVADLVGKGFVLDGWAGFDAEISQRFENAYEAAVIWGRLPTCGSISAREDSDSVTERGMSFGVHAQAPRQTRVAQSLDGNV